MRHCTVMKRSLDEQLFCIRQYSESKICNTVQQYSESNNTVSRINTVSPRPVTPAYACVYACMHVCVYACNVAGPGTQTQTCYRKHPKLEILTLLQLHMGTLHRVPHTSCGFGYTDIRRSYIIWCSEFMCTVGSLCSEFMCTVGPLWK
jgi:hypothetical protein